MISKADALKAKKAMQAPTLEEVAKRLWDCHEKHLGRVDQLRQLLESELNQNSSKNALSILVKLKKSVHMTFLWLKDLIFYKSET